MEFDNSKPLSEYTMDELLTYLRENLPTCVIAAQIADDKNTCNTFMYYTGNSASMLGLAAALHDRMLDRFKERMSPMSEYIEGDYNTDEDDDEDGDDESKSPAD